MALLEGMMGPPPEADDGLDGGAGLDALGLDGGTDFESLLQEAFGMLPKTPDRTAPVGDAAATLADKGMFRIGGDEVQDLGAFRRTQLRQFQKRMLGRDPRSRLTVTVDGMKFFRDKSGNVVPFSEVAIGDFGKPAVPGVTRIGEAEAIPEGFSPSADPAMLAKARQEAQVKAAALLEEKEAREAEVMPAALESALLANAAKIKPGDDPTAMFQALVQKSGEERDKAARDRLENAFNLALKRAGFEERVAARKERAIDRRAAEKARQEAKAERAAARKEEFEARRQDRKVQQEMLAWQKEQEVERKRSDRVQGIFLRLGREARDIENDPLVMDKEAALETLLTRTHAAMMDADRPAFEQMARAAYGWRPAGAEDPEVAAITAGEAAPAAAGEGAAPATPAAPASPASVDAKLAVKQAEQVAGLDLDKVAQSLFGAQVRDDSETLEQIAELMEEFEGGTGDELAQGVRDETNLRRLAMATPAGMIYNALMSPIDFGRMLDRSSIAKGESSDVLHVKQNMRNLVVALTERGLDDEHAQAVAVEVMRRALELKR